MCVHKSVSGTWNIKLLPFQRSVVTKQKRELLRTNSDQIYPFLSSSLLVRVIWEHGVKAAAFLYIYARLCEFGFPLRLQRNINPFTTRGLRERNNLALICQVPF